MSEIHLPAIIQDLALILIVAGATTLLFKAIRQPVVLGYIIAGFLVGPSFHWFPTVADVASVKVWAEIGVIFLLFALGLEFSFKKLVRVGPSASITAVVEILGMIGIGFLIGRAFGWNDIDSLFLGGILAISSTTIIIRAFDELGLKTRGFARLVFGVLIVEDLVAILLMVVLSTVAVSQTFSGVEMGFAALKLGFFLVLWFVLGIFLLPTFLKRARSYMNAETLLVVALGLCFAMVVAATKVGFSPALGAFIMGSLLAETSEGERIEHLVSSVKDLFAAVFFVSVGMLIDPNVLAEYWLPVVVITFATIVGKLLTTTLGALLSGQSLRRSVQAGMSLAQIGEFSFIIASLGLSLKVTSEFLFPIAISVSAVTTFTTPYLIRSADRTVETLQRVLPPRWIAVLETFHAASTTVGHTSEWREVVRAYAPKVVVNSVVVIGIFLAMERLVLPVAIGRIGDVETASLICLVASFVLAAPFTWALAFGRIQARELSTLWSERRFKGPLLALEVARWTITLLLLGLLAGRFVSAGTIVLSVTVIVFAGFFLVSKSLGRVYQWLERRFVQNLSAKEESERGSALPPLAPWDAHLAELKITADSALIGKRLAEAKIRETYGVSIALIERGSRVYPAPSRDDILFPGDVLHVIGTDEQISKLKSECEIPAVDHRASFDYSLRPLNVAPTSAFAHRTIRESGLREKVKGLVVGIEKNGKRILNPDSSTVIEPGDVLWIVADRASLSHV